MTLEEALARPTMPIPEAGEVFYGLGRNAAYEAARRGDIPTVKIGGRKLAVVSVIAQKLGLPFTAGTTRS
jgi:hypothetical protein